MGMTGMIPVANRTHARRMALAFDPNYTFVRLRVSVSHPCLLSGKPRAQRVADWCVVEPYSCWRCGYFSISHHSRRPHWPAAHADCRRHIDGGRRAGLRFHAQFPVSGRGGHDWCHQSERQRSGAFSLCRASRSTVTTTPDHTFSGSAQIAHPVGALLAVCGD